MFFFFPSRLFSCEIWAGSSFSEMNISCFCSVQPSAVRFSPESSYISGDEFCGDERSRKLTQFCTSVAPLPHFCVLTSASTGQICQIVYCNYAKLESPAAALWPCLPPLMGSLISRLRCGLWWCIMSGLKQSGPDKQTTHTRTHAQRAI